MLECPALEQPRFRSAGFTIIELMIVVMIIGILSSIAALKINQAMRKANEGSSHGNLGAIRSAIGIYYSDNVTTYPGSLAALTLNAKYLKAFPETTLIGYHSKTSAIREGSGAAAIDDAGGWAYNNDAGHADFGKIMVNCTHTDTKSSVWSEF